MSNCLFYNTVNTESLAQSLKEALRGNTKYKRDAMLFCRDETENLKTLHNELINGTYRFGGYHEFKVYEPKERIINAPEFRDKVVQLSLNRALKPVLHPKFVYDSYACIDGKGTHSCSNRLQSFMKKARWQYGEGAYAIKIDIKKFFYNIDREVLTEIMKKKVNCKRTMRLISEIIDSAAQIDSKGLPLGNTLSQVCANVYMNQLDQHCKRALSVKYYLRYADDICMIVKSKGKAKVVLRSTIGFLNDQLRLEANEKKTCIFPLSQGINMVGFKTRTTHKNLRDKSKTRIKGKIKKFPHLIESGKLSVEKAENMMNSWWGHARHGDCHNFKTSLLDRYPWVGFKDGKFYIEKGEN